MTLAVIRPGKHPVIRPGENTGEAARQAVRAAGFADAAAASEAVALAAAGPNYASTAAGLADTSEGDTFAVADDGIVTIYRHDSGPTATELRVLATTAALASTDTGKGDTLVGSKADATGAVARTTRARINDRPLSVKDFGTVGDGDDTAAVAAAITYCGANKRELVFPLGTYMVDPLAFDHSVSTLHGLRIRGEGWSHNGGGSRIKFRNTEVATGALFAIESGANLTFINRLQISNIAFDAGAAGGDTLFRAIGLFDFVFDNVYFGGLTAGGMDLFDGDQWVIGKFRDCYFRYGANGPKTKTIDGYTTHFANVIEHDHCTFDDLDVSSDYREGGRSILYTNCTTEPALDGSAATHYGAEYDSTFIGCWFGDANYTGTWIYGDGESLRVDKCDLTQADIGVADYTTCGATVADTKFGCNKAVEINSARTATIRKNNIILPANGIGVDIVGGVSHEILDNRVVKTGGATGTTAYRLQQGSRGHIRDRIGSTADTFISEGTTKGNWTKDIRNKRMTGTTTTNVLSIAAGATATVVVTVEGAADGDMVAFGLPASLSADIQAWAKVTAADTVTIYLHNPTGSAIDPPSLTYTAMAFANPWA